MVHCSHNSSLKSLPGAAILTVEQTPHIHLATHLSDAFPNEVGEGSIQLEEPWLASALQTLKIMKLSPSSSQN